MSSRSVMWRRGRMTFIDVYRLTRAVTQLPRRVIIRTKDSGTALCVCADYSDMMNRTFACVVLNRYSSVVAIRRKASSVIDPMDAPG
jgi:hypothetical protein